MFNKRDLQKRDTKTLIVNDTKEGYKKHCEQRYMVENYTFLVDCYSLLNSEANGLRSNITPNELDNILNTYVKRGSEKQLNLSVRTAQDLDKALSSGDYAIAYTSLRKAVSEVEQLLHHNTTEQELQEVIKHNHSHKGCTLF